MLYDRFLDLCVEKGVSVSQALREAGISRNAVHNWKNGSMPNPLTRKKLERYFGVSLNEFMAHDDGLAYYLFIPYASLHESITNP